MLTLIAIGASRNSAQCVYSTNGHMFLKNSIDLVLDGVPQPSELSAPQKDLVVFGTLERLEGETEGIERFRELAKSVKAGSGQLVLGVNCDPDSFPLTESEVLKTLPELLVFPVDEEEISLPVRELIQMELWPSAGRFAALYKERYLDLFPPSRTDTLCENQLLALEEMKHIVHRLTDLYRGLFMQRVQRIINDPGIYNDPVPADWDAETIASAICYVFWNRFNCDDEGYEVGFARSGLLGAYLLQLKGKDV